jgi:hypothetical protein
MKKRVAWAVVAGIVLGVTAPAHAHWADLAVAEIVVQPTETRVTLTFPTGLVEFADTDKNGQITADEIAAHKNDLVDFFQERVQLFDTNHLGHLSIAPASAVPPASVSVSPKTHSSLLLTYEFSDPIQELTMRYGLFFPGVSTASLLATVIRENRVQNFVFTPDLREHSLVSPSLWQQASSFVLLGIEHIFTGYDHVLFLTSLLMMAGATLRYLTKVVTAFTVAHSITLSLAVLDVVSLPSQWVESAIALTIVYVAMENFWRKVPGKRWLWTFGFGLVHGLGFASVLQEIGLPKANLAVALAGFNVGVELGQLAIVAIVFSLMRALSFFFTRIQWERDQTVRLAVSAGAVVFGLLWFVDRAFAIGFMPF